MSKIASNYSPLPVQIVKGKDIFLWDHNNKRYVDLLAGYSAVNQGHCHPKIVKSLIEQSKRLTLSSRVVDNDQLVEWSEYITSLFQLANKDKMDVFTPGTHGSTFGGNPLACAISKTALSVIQKECIPNVKNVSSETKLYLSELLGNHNKYIKDIRGTGLFWGVQFHANYSIENLRLRMLEKGYITCTSRYHTLRITPPLTISIKEIRKAIYTLKKCL